MVVQRLMTGLYEPVLEEKGCGQRPALVKLHVIYMRACVFLCVRDWARENESKQRKRQREREREKETDRQRERGERGRDKERGRYRETETKRQRHRQRDRQIFDTVMLVCNIW